MAALTSASVTTTIDQGRRVFNLDDGLKVAVVDLGLVTAANVINPAGTIALDSTDLRRLGFSKLLAVLDGAAWTSAAAYVASRPTLDGKTNKILIYDTAGALLPAASVGNGGTVRLVLLGM